jgi:hypothetical protein
MTAVRAGVIINKIGDMAMPKFEKGDTIRYKRDETSIKFVSSKLICVLALSIALMTASVIGAFIFFIEGRCVAAVLCVAAACLLFAFGKYCDGLEWFRDVEYVFYGSKFKYTYKLDSTVLPVSHADVSVAVKKVDSIKVVKDRHGHIIGFKVTGELIKNAPMQKPRTINSFVMKDVPDCHDEIAERLSKMFDVNMNA